MGFQQPKLVDTGFYLILFALMLPTAILFLQFLSFFFMTKYGLCPGLIIVRLASSIPFELLVDKTCTFFIVYFNLYSMDFEIFLFIANVLIVLVFLGLALLFRLIVAACDCSVKLIAVFTVYIESLMPDERP